MELTVGVFKKILDSVDDNVVLGTLSIGNDSFHPFQSVKRLLVLNGDDGWENKTFLVINDMGSHFSGEGGQKGLTYAKRHFDENTIK